MRHIQTLAFVLAAGAAALAADPKPASELPEIKELPNPFVFQDGSPVKTKADWQRRRTEIAGLFEYYMYGHMPAKPKSMKVERGEVIVDEENKLTIQPLELKLEQDGKSLTLHVRLVLPQDAKAPLPVIVQSSFGGFGKGTTKSAPGKPFAAFTTRGYAVAEMSFNEVAIDNKDRARTAGIYKLYDDKIDCGGLMAWAWGVSRLIDALESEKTIDVKKVIVTGHSRYGKAALVAGAYDTRIALTVPSHSGCGGAAPYRFIYGKNEQLHNVVGAFPYWFRPNFNQFVDNVQRLPVDQHLLAALVAPRAQMRTEGTQDIWINPEGSQLTHLAAKKIYDFLGAGDQISIRYRPVGHIPSNEDLMDYADHIFWKKPLPVEFGKLAYKEDKNGFSWDVPK